MLSHCKLIKEEFKQPQSLALFMNGDVHHIDAGCKSSCRRVRDRGSITGQRLQGAALK